MIDHSSIEFPERQRVHTASKIKSEEYFVIDSNKCGSQLDLAILGQSGNSEIDDILPALIREKIKGEPANIELTVLALKELKTSSPNMAAYIDDVISQLSVYARFSINKPLKLLPTLLVGAPGTGKTYIAAKIAATIGIWHGNISLSLATESFILSGCPRGYSTATPGDIAQRMAKSDCINPLLILDELDKASFYPGSRPSITGPLLQVLEADTASQFEDACLKCELDVSHVSWLATANDISLVPEPLLSRFHIIHIQETDHEEKLMQVQRIASSVTEDMELSKYFTVEVARNTFEKYSHLSIRAWKIKLQLAISLKASNSLNGEHLVVREEDMRRLVHEKKTTRIGFV